MLWQYLLQEFILLNYSTQLESSAGDVSTFCLIIFSLFWLFECAASHQTPDSKYKIIGVGLFRPCFDVPFPPQCVLLILSYLFRLAIVCLYITFMV